MKEGPILFSGQMVRAILANRKSQTRRVMNPQPPDWIDRFGYTAFTPDGHISGRGRWNDEPAEKFFKSRYGVSADRLWVRETFNCNDYRYPDGPRQELLKEMIYRADHDDNCTCFEEPMIWRPSIFMPRWASRITLEITSVRVERLQEITDADALAEGVDRTNTSIPGYARERFTRLWDHINGKRAPWSSNPWLWVVKFKRLEEK